MDGYWDDTDGKELHNLILVSKSWASAAIPLLWRYHAKVEHLIYMLFGFSSAIGYDEVLDVSATINILSIY